MTRKCDGCTRSIVIPEVWMDASPAADDILATDVWTCGMCGTRNKFPIMVVLPHPQTQEASK